jgi:predicted ATPase
VTATGTVRPPGEELIRTPDQRIRVFISSTLDELAEERRAVRSAVERLHLSAVMFELGARPHPPRTLYRAYLRQSHVFIGLYYERYGWVGPGEDVSGLEDEFRLSAGMPRLLYVKRSTGTVEPRLRTLLTAIREGDTASYRSFADATELAGLVEEDLAALLSERFMGAGNGTTPGRARPDAGSPPPVPLTPTVGRDRDVAEVVRLLEQGVRLLTITGPGGIGKSRLSLEVAPVAADLFPDGVVFVALESLMRPELVLQTIAERISAPDSGARPLLDVLADELADRHLLLMIDNMEHLVAAGPALAELLGRCPGVAALVTSRHALRLRGEREYHLGPLTLPLAGDESTTLAPAVDLFVQRAVAANPAFRLTPANRAPIAQLVRLLDGLPLAIELAAARTRLLAPAALLDRLTHHDDVLADGAGDLPPRQRTLRATLDWSYQLLDPAERVLFTRMSVFADSATLDAVEAVCGDDQVPDVLHTVSSLLEKSLLVSSAADGADPPRTRMLQTLRARAAELLADRGETATLRARHARWYADFAGPGDVLRNDQAPRWWPSLDAEIAELRTASRWAIELPDGPLMVDLARRLWPWLWSTGRLGELSDAVSQALLTLPADAPPRERGYLTYVSANVQTLRGGNFPAALALADEALRQFERSDDVDRALLVAAARLARGTLRAGVGRQDGVAADMDVAVATARRAHSGWLLGYATSHRGLRRAMLGDLAGARADHEESLAVAEAIGHEVLVAQAIGQLAMVDVLQGRLDDGRARVREQVDHLLRTRNLEGLANALDTTSTIAVAMQRWDVAARTGAAAAGIRDRVGIAAWPLIREYHDASVGAARGHLGERWQKLAAEVGHADPWQVVDDALSQLREPFPR